MVLIFKFKRNNDAEIYTLFGLKYLQLDFEEKVIPLGEPDTSCNIELISPAGTVPCLNVDEVKIWDSLAILEFAGEIPLNKKIFPTSLALRALARSIIF